MNPIIWLLAFQMGSPGQGETQAIALHPTDPEIIYAGAGKGLCKTLKGGKDNWPTVGLDRLSPRVIVLDPVNPEVVYAGTYEMGVYKSSDGGAHWVAMNEGLTYRAVRALAITPEAVYAGTDGGGVFISTDGGAHWSESNRGLIDKTVRALVADSRDPRTLYAGTWHGVYKSTDAGASWAANPSGLYDVDVVALALDPTNSSILYAATNPRGVWRSADGGASWAPGAKPLTEHLQAIAVDPHTPTHVYLGTRAGVFRSIDSGDNFEPAGLAWSNSVWTLVFDSRTKPATLYYGGVGGVLKTVNGGQWWNVTGPIRP
jgi:photosystem II stability/assembly factor-like uncharacterized protein